jgi:hypothetical protein
MQDRETWMLALIEPGSDFRSKLFSDSEFFDQLTVAAEIVFLKIVQQAFALAYQLHKAAMRGEVFFVGLEMTRDLGDTFCQYRNLPFD